MNDVRYEWRAHRWSRWGPAHLVRRRDSIEVQLGDVVVGIDLTDRRPAAERQADPYRSVFADGVPVTWNGEQVATVTTSSGSRTGLARRQQLAVTGDDRFVLPGLAFTHRGLPFLLTLRSGAGNLVASRRWASPLNMAVTEWSIVREHDLVPPKVAREARPEHIALWLAVKEALAV
ncbi:hypothetical protein GL325_12610 [Aeromicrobium sp. 636]|uniref:Uncharacterized protein n=1 Tax=Aeromicrobium senzhongii TaxID=2663859 RepID=A0A8I0K0M0_9ACTN|nr:MULTISPECIES: hypothetical protein [Aeromicrobium]MBC9227167.1 hypothetical protein [Aeromicrobium senzhongii]MCQ3999266.1 hypothetical protein [Aeromicrobium sp. 636]